MCENVEQSEWQETFQTQQKWLDIKVLPEGKYMGLQYKLR